MQIIKLTILISFVCIFPANAYIGPGITGIIATIIGFILTILVALFVIIFYPIKKLSQELKKKK